MIIRLVALVVFLTLSFCTAASPVTVTVTEKISGKSDSVVRQNARIKAQYAGIERLPVVMAGYEQLTDKKFTTNIKAYLVGEVNVLAMKEVWDRDNDTYKLTAKVSLNRQASLEMIEGIRNNLSLQKKLQKLYKSLDNLAGYPSISSKHYTAVHDKILNVKGSALVRDTIADSIKAKNDFIANSYRYYNERYMQPLIESVKVEVTSIDESDVYYTVRLDISDDVRKEMYEYWFDNKTRKEAYVKKQVDICLPRKERLRILSEEGRLSNSKIVKNYETYHLGDERFAQEPHKVIYPSLCYIENK